LYLSLNYALKKMPIKFINIPNKDYWLKSDKKDHIISTISSFIFQFGIACNTLFICLELIIFKINLNKGTRLNITTVNIIMGIFIVYIIILIIQLYRKFRKPV